MILQKVIGDYGRIWLIAGSRDHNGNVPRTNWNNGKFQVWNYNPDNYNDNLRSRSEVLKKNLLNKVLFLQIIYPASRHFGDFLQFFLENQVGFFINNFQLHFQAD